MELDTKIYTWLKKYLNRNVCQRNLLPTSAVSHQSNIPGYKESNPKVNYQCISILLLGHLKILKVFGNSIVK